MLSPRLFTTTFEWAMQKWRPRAENSACGIGLEDGVSTLMDVGFADDRLIIVCLEDPQPHHHGWQQTAVIQVHRRFRTKLQATLDPAGRAMLESQSGPFASRVFTTVPYTADFAYPQPPLPSPLATQTSSPPPSHCTCLSVPSRFIPSWRPPCSMPEIRGTSKPRHPLE